MKYTSQLGIFIRVCVLCVLFASIVSAQPSGFRRNTIAIGWGYNYWGNTEAISYEHRISNKWSVGISFSRGLFDFVHKTQETMFFIKNEHPYDLYIDIHIRRFLDFMVYYNRNAKKDLAFFSKFGYGLSHYYVQFEESMFPNGYEFRGTKDFLNIALVFSGNLVEYRPKYANALSFSLGIMVHATLLDSPLEMYIYYEDIPYYLYMTSWTGFHPMPYPQMFFKVGFSL